MSLFDTFRSNHCNGFTHPDPLSDQDMIKTVFNSQMNAIASREIEVYKGCPACGRKAMCECLPAVLNVTRCAGPDNCNNPCEYRHHGLAYCHAHLLMVLANDNIHCKKVNPPGYGVKDPREKREITTSWMIDVGFLANGVKNDD